ncbi:MAG: non-canonical purine NTP pyrophosphatase [Pseudomonadota bacterium]
MKRGFKGTTLLIATHNRGKMEEIARLMAPFAVETVSAGDLGLDPPEETATTFAGNAKIKARAAATAANMIALSDDSGIEVDALRGAPGVHTADWAETGNGRDFRMAMTRTWEELEAIDAPFPRTGRFRCALALAWPDGHTEVFDGKIEGRIVWPMRGTKGHGYDPIFQPDGYDVTLGEMDRWRKNEISHRADAFGKLVDSCFRNRS